MDVTGTPQYAALKDQTEQQYGQAKNNLLETVQPGGSLTNALSGLERARASSLVQGAGDISNQELSRAFAFGTGQAPVGLGGMGNAAQVAAYSSAMAGQQQAASNRMLGNAIGNYMSRGNQPSGGKGSTSGGEAGGSAGGMSGGYE